MALAVTPIVAGPYYLGLAATVGVNALLAMGLVLVTGYAGQFSLAQGAFFGVGAYGSGLLTFRFGLSPLLALVAAALIALALAYALPCAAARPPSCRWLGQQKLVEIARALAREPDVLLLDEPGAGLNSQEKAELAVTLRGLRDTGTAVLVIEHDMEFVMGVADRMHVLDFGETLRVGTPAEVQADPAVVAAYLGTEVPSARA